MKTKLHNHLLSKNSNEADTTVTNLQPNKIKNASTQKTLKNNVMDIKPSKGLKKSCICAPTSHQGSFKCQLHRASSATQKSPSSTSPGYNNDSTMNNTQHSMFDAQNTTTQLSRFGRAALAHNKEHRSESSQVMSYN